MLAFSSEIIHIAELIREISAENHVNITKREIRFQKTLRIIL